jgi:hypothetical protein
MDDHEIIDLRTQMRSLVFQSKQSSYNRSYPDKKAIPRIKEFIVRLQKLIDSTQYSPEVLLLMSQAKEMILEYKSALHYMQLYIDTSYNTEAKKYKKKIWQLQEGVEFWEKIILTPTEFMSMGCYLEKNYCSTNLDATTEWLVSNGFPDDIVCKIIGYLHSKDIYTDLNFLEVLIDS